MPSNTLTGADSVARRIGEAHAEPDWLSDLRDKAWAAYEAAPLPDRVAHLWRYTAPEQFVPSADAFGVRRSEKANALRGWPVPLAAAWERGEISGAAAACGSRVIRTGIRGEAVKGGVILGDLHEAASRHPDRVRPHLGSAVGPDFGKFEALNAAVWEGGLFLCVPRGVALTAPIHLLRDLGTGAGHPAPRLLVVVEEGAEVTVIDEYAGGGAPDGGRGGVAGAPQANAVVEIVAQPSARVRYVLAQNLDRTVIAHFTQRARVERDAHFLLAQAALGAAVSKADSGAVLAGRGAEVLLLGVAVGDGRQHFDHHTVHDHQAGHSRSNLDFKVVLRDRARSVYTGLIRIAHGAANSEAYQENRNLLLSDGCKVESIPELEILTDEVMCTHGATMGPIDPEHVFYLMARGVPRDDAVRLIVSGFIEPTLARMPEDLRGRVRGHVARKLGIEEDEGDANR